jgi:hypothetical protein
MLIRIQETLSLCECNFGGPHGEVTFETGRVAAGGSRCGVRRNSVV